MKKSHGKPRFFAGLIAVLVGLVLFAVCPQTETVAEAASGPADAPLSLGPLIRVGGTYDSAYTSAFDGINIRRTKQDTKVSWGWLDVRLEFDVNALDDVENVWVRFSHPSTITSSLKDVIFYMIDANNVVYGWNNTISATQNPATGVVTAAPIGETNHPSDAGEPVDVYMNWQYTRVTADAERWYIYPREKASQRKDATAYKTDTAEFDWTGVKYALIRVPMDSAYFDLNIGEIYGEKSDGTFVRVFDPVSVTVGTSASDSVYLSVRDGVAASGYTLQDAIGDYRVAKIRNGEIYVPDSVNVEWYGLPMTGLPTDVTGYNGVSYYADLTDCGDIYINKYLVDTSNPGGEQEYWWSNYGRAMYYPDGGSAYVGDINTIPGGFKGTIVVPFCGFVPNSGKETKDNVFDLEHTTGTFGFTVKTTVGKGSFVIKDVKFVSDAKVRFSVRRYVQREDGSYGEPAYHSVDAIAGSSYTPETTVNEFVLDADNPNNCLEGAAAFEGGRTNRIKEGLYGSGNVIWSYLPKVYYQYTEAAVISKVFGLDGIKDVYPMGTSVKDILAQFPSDGITVGNSRLGLIQLEGRWTAEEQAGSWLQITFVPDAMPEGLVDTNNLLTMRVRMTDTPKAPVALTVTPPMKVVYETGGAAELAGLSVTLRYDDLTTEQLKAGQYTVSGFDTSVAGEKKVTVTYGDLSAEFTITVLQGKTDENAGTASTTEKGCGGSAAASGGGLLLAAAVALFAKRRAK